MVMDKNYIDSFINYVEKLLIKVFSFKWFYYIALIIVSFFLYYFNFRYELVNYLNKGSYINYYYMGSFIFITIILLLILFNNKVRKICIHKKFLIISLFLCLLYTFGSPVFTQSDESFHFIRAYQVAEGHLLSPVDNNGNSYDYFPKSIYKTLYDDDDYYPEYKNYDDYFKESKIPLDKNTVEKKDVRASNYVFLNYFPHAIGIKLGILLNLSPYFIALLGRISNMLICIILISLGIKIIPVCKKIFFILFLSPSILSYISSLSADGIVIAINFLFISLVVKYIYEKPKLNYLNYLLFLLLIAFVSTCKAAYLPIIGIIILLPYECFKNKKNKWLFTLSLVFFGIFFSLLWMNLGNVNISDIQGYEGISKYTHFVYIFVNTFMQNTVSYVENIFAGDYMYQCQLKPYTIIPIAYLFLFLISIFSEDSDLKVRFIEKIIVLIIAFLVIVLIAYALFTANTAVGEIVINGIQGRYFVPVVLLFVFFVGTKKFNVNHDILIDCSIILNLYVLLNMILVFSL